MSQRPKKFRLVSRMSLLWVNESAMPSLFQMRFGIAFHFQTLCLTVLGCPMLWLMAL